MITSRPIRGVVNTWASVWHHRLAGGDGFPALEECLGIEGNEEPDPPSRDELLAALNASERKKIKAKGLPIPGVRICDDSEMLYDATRDKYEEAMHLAGNPVVDQRTFAAFVNVEATLIDMSRPPLLVGLLLHLYPEVGRFVPARNPGFDPNAPHRSYRPQAWTMITTGTLEGDSLDRTVDLLMKRIENVFWRSLSDRLRGPGIKVRNLISSMTENRQDDEIQVQNSDEIGSELANFSTLGVDSLPVY